MKATSIFFKITTVILAVATIASTFSGHINPGTFWIFGVLGLVFLPLFTLNLVVLIGWILVDRKYSLIPLVAFICTLTKLSLVLQPGINIGSGRISAKAEKNEIRVVSFNVRVFDLYNWTMGDHTRQRIFETIKELNPDIICFQEFFSSKDRMNHNNIATIKSMTGMQYYHAEFSITRFNSDQYGIATFSKFPITQKGIIKQEKSSTNLTMFTDLKVPQGDTIRVYNCHLQSIRFKSDDYAFIEDPVNSPSATNRLGKTLSMLRLLKKAYSYRASQAMAMAEHISKSGKPVLVCGDFNDTPISFTYKTISDGLEDAFVEMGKGIGATYAGPIPGLRIDYILYGERFGLSTYSTPKKQLSDHLPLVVDLKLNP